MLSENENREKSNVWALSMHPSVALKYDRRGSSTHCILCSAYCADAGANDINFPIEKFQQRTQKKNFSSWRVTQTPKNREKERVREFEV